MNIFVFSSSIDEMKIELKLNNLVRQNSLVVSKMTEKNDKKIKLFERLEYKFTGKHMVTICANKKNNNYIYNEK